MAWAPEDDDFSRMFASSDDQLAPQPAQMSRWRLLDAGEALAAMASFAPDDWMGEPMTTIGRGLSSGVENRVLRVGAELASALKKWGRGAPFALLAKKTHKGRPPGFFPGAQILGADGKMTWRRDPSKPPAQLQWERRLALVIRDIVAQVDWIVDWGHARAAGEPESWAAITAQGERPHEALALAQIRLECAQRSGLAQFHPPKLLVGLPGETPKEPANKEAPNRVRQALADWDGLLQKEPADWLFAALEAQEIGRGILSKDSTAENGENSGMGKAKEMASRRL